MKKLILLAALALPLAAQTAFDFSSLDKLGANAKDRTSISLDGDMLKLASSLMGEKSGDDARKLVESLKGVFIRTFEFPGAGLYKESDLEPLRAYLRQGKWRRIVESREDGELSEIFVLPEAGNTLGGVAIITAEARELSVIFIEGSMKAEDLLKLGGNLGIPDLSGIRNAGRAGTSKTPKPAAAPTKEED